MQKYHNLFLIFQIASVALISTLIFVGCAHPVTAPIEMAEWTRVPEIGGCISYVSAHNEPHDINIKLKPNLEAELLSLLRGKEAKSPLCWYEKPNGNIFLNAGEYCGFPKEAYFQKTELGWALIEFKEMYVQCDLKQK